jgi:hypothetical protein
VWAAVLGALAAGAMLWVATVYVSRGNGKGDLAPQQEFFVGKAESLADRTPFLLPDASPSHRRDVYIQHLGDDLDTGWLALGALAPGQTDRECFLKVRGDHFEDPCTDATFPEDGTGLTAYPTEVRDGRVYVDLNPD